MNKLAVKLFLAVIIALSLYSVYTNYKLNKAYSEIASLQVSKDSVRQLADSSMARLASTSVEKDSLRDALSAAKTLNGRLIAAARIRIQPRSDSGTIVLQPKDTNQVLFGFADSLETGFMHGTITVIPPPDSIAVDYTFDPFPLELTVAVIQMRDNGAVFAVRYRGGQTTIEAPFAKIPPKQKFLTSYVEGLYNPFDKSAALRAGLQSFIPFFRRTNVLLIAEGEQQFRGTNSSNLYLGVRKVF